MTHHENFSTLFELLPIGAYRTSLDGRQMRANAAMVAMFGFTTEADMLSHIKAGEGGWYVDPGRRAQFREQLEAHGAVRNFISEMQRHGSGETFWINENAHVVRDAQGTILYHEGTVEDVTERKEAETTLQMTLDNAGRGIARISAQGAVVLYNQRLLELLDLPEALLATRPLLDDVLAYQKQRGDFGANYELLDVDPMRALYPETVQGQTLLQQGRYLRRTLKGRVLEVATQPLPDGGKVRTFTDVTDYFNAQSELAEKSRILQVTMDSMSQGIATIDASGRAITSNRRHQELLGFSAELMATQPTMEQLVRFQIERGDFGEGCSYVDAVARGYVTHGDSIPATQAPETYTRRTHDGHTLEVKTLPLPDGGVVRTFTDVTAYVQAQDALAQKEAQLGALVKNIPDRVWLKDAEGVYLLSNPAHWRGYGLQEQDVVGKTATELFGEAEGALQRQTDLQAMDSAQPLVYEGWLYSATEGEQRQMELVKVAMRDEAGRSVGILGIARDITERKSAEAALIAARDEAEAGNRAKAEFLANMSHEIRTPMNAVIGMSDLLLDTPLTAAQREYAQTIHTSGEALMSLINDILDFSKMESGHMALEHVPVNLAECVENALELTSGPALANGLDLLYWIEDDTPRGVYGDPTRLRQILVNLLSNAIKFTPQGEVVVTLARRQAADGSPLLHCAVRDTGIGIPADRMDRLFQVFSQVDMSTTRQYGGTGLGLAICRRLVGLMGGRIWVDSEPGKGSNFQFEVPCEAVPSGPSAYVNRRAAALAGRRVLVVDDNPTNRRILSLQTARWGMVAQAVASGREALDCLAGGARFDLAIIDVQMPFMDGYSLAAKLREQFSPEELPIVVLTSAGSTVAPRADLGLAHILSKPTKALVLFDAINDLFERATGPASAPAPLQTSVQRLAHTVPLRILLVEDNLVNQRVAALILSGLGYDIQMVSDGVQALDAVAQAMASGAPHDVVLMDVQMPGMDGLEATRQLRSRYPGPGQGRPWIIAMTANAMAGDREECLAAGMDDYLSKPIRAAAVGEALRRAGKAFAVLAQTSAGRIDSVIGE